MTRSRVLATFVALSATLSACRGAGGPGKLAPSPSVGSGQGEIVATVLLAGICPHEATPGDPACAPRPWGGAMVVVRATDGQELARGESSPDGVVRFLLAPGDYVVLALQDPRAYVTPMPIRVRVMGGDVVTVTLIYNTGIQ